MQFYARRAYHFDLLSQRRPPDKETRKELDFLEYAFKKKASRNVKRVLDVACGGGRHIVGLAQKGYQCTAQDYTPERVEITKQRAARSNVSIELRRGDAPSSAITASLTRSKRSTFSFYCRATRT
jgi:2-polyprenyl-3-methyl-5-hydroxy-6-metoxy-1,4-benzoquinol methylase